MLAAEIRATPIARDDEFLAALDDLGREFATIDSAGAVKYGRFMAEDAASHDQFARRAVGALAALLGELRS